MRFACLVIFGKDLFNICEDFGRLASASDIQPNDIRHSNILFSPAAPPGFPVRKCPFRQRRHKYRVLDFDYAKKNKLDYQHNVNTDSTLGSLLEEGFIAELGILKHYYC
jgi:hypothetical protein